MENPHDLFIVTGMVWRKVDDIYSFNNIYASTPLECIKQHFVYCGSMTAVLNKPKISGNMIAAPKGYDSKEKHLGENTQLKHADIILNLDV